MSFIYKKKANKVHYGLRQKSLNPEVPRTQQTPRKGLQSEGLSEGEQARQCQKSRH